MTRNYKFRLYPTKAQNEALHKLVDQHCDLYNTALEQRRVAWGIFKENVTYNKQAAELSELRTAFPEFAQHGYSAMQQTLRRLNKAFQRFFARCKTGETPGYPRFKPKSRFKSVAFPAGDGASFKENAKDWKADAQRKQGRQVAPKAWSLCKIKGNCSGLLAATG
jgi:putative transposase